MSSPRYWPFLLGAVALAACGDSRATAPASIALPVPTSTPARPLPFVEPTAAPKASAEPVPGPVSADYAIVLHRGDGPCVVRFWAASTQDFPEQVLLTDVSKIETLKSPACAANVMFDVPNADHGVWTGGSLPKPGHEAALAGGPLQFIDVDGDGYLDIDFYIVHSPYLDEHPQFVFDPGRRIFY